MRRGRRETAPPARCKAMSSKAPAKRGPKSAVGKLAVRFNASTHGILSLQPIVHAYESPQDWESHREAIIGALSPDGGMEQLLAERVASCSWRLNRVLLYESEQIAEAQEGVVEFVRQKRKRELQHERIFAKEGEEVQTDIGILIEAHPANALDDVRMARQVYKTACKVLEGPPKARIEGEMGAWVLGLVAEHAVRLAASQEGNGAEPGSKEVELPSEALQERLPGIPEGTYLGDVEWRVGQLRELIKWLAEEAGVQADTQALDGSIVDPHEQLMETLRIETRYDLTSKEAKAEEVQAQLLTARRGRILPSEEDLQKIARYEAHLSRQMYQALHELEALQRRRSGGEAPLARVDVQT
jgi:hypothetical protein